LRDQYGKAANNAAQRVRKKVRKNVSDGIAHVHASFNNTIITITDARATLCRGLRRVVKASRARASRRPLLPRSPEVAGRAAIEQGIKNLDVEIKGPARVANPPFAHWVPWASASRPSPT
jgi:small subunit ribosomal protein S11